MSGPPPDALEAIAVEVATAASALLAQAFASPRTTVETKSTSTDMVTEMDRAVERHITQRLAAERPDDAIIGEEGTARPGSSGVCWIVDPLDGTTNYLYRQRAYAVSLAAEHDGVIVAGAVADPFASRVFSAHLGGGARLDGLALACSTEQELSRALIGTGFSYEPARRQRQARLLAGLIDRIRDIRRLGAAALDLCLVAEGSLDGFYEAGLAPWDHAAGLLIASEAGARTTTVPGAGTEPAAVVAAAPGVFDALRGAPAAADRAADAPGG